MEPTSPGNGLGTDSLHNRISYAESSTSSADPNTIPTGLNPQPVTVPKTFTPDVANVRQRFGELNQHLMQAAKGIAMPPVQDVFNFQQLQNLAFEEVPPKLMEPFLPKAALSVHAGPEDSGKSMFLRQLAVSVAAGLPEFCGFRLNLEHRSAIYLSTEDGEYDNAYFFNKQAYHLGIRQANLRFVLGSLFDSLDAIIQRLDTLLHEQPADLLVIDSLGDMLRHLDGNSASHTRTALGYFNTLAKRHKVAVVFLHHLKKGSKGLTPDTEHLLGSSGISQTARCVLQQMRPNGADQVFITCVKGNSILSQHKHKSHELLFSEETALFTPTGVVMPSGQLMDIYRATGAGSHGAPIPNGNGGYYSPKVDKWKQAVLKAFEGVDPQEGLRHKDLVERLSAGLGVKEATIKKDYLPQLTGEVETAPKLLEKRGEGKSTRYFLSEQLNLPFAEATPNTPQSFAPTAQQQSFPLNSAYTTTEPNSNDYTGEEPLGWID